MAKREHSDSFCWKMESRHGQKDKCQHFDGNFLPPRRSIGRVVYTTSSQLKTGAASRRSSKSQSTVLT